MNELVNSPLGGEQLMGAVASIEVGEPATIDATSGADAMLRELEEVRDSMRRAIDEARPKPEIVEIFIRATDISDRAAGAEAQYKKKKDTNRHAAFREAALRVDLLLAQWLVETEKEKLRFMGRHAKGKRAGTPAPPHLITLSDFFPRHSQNQVRKRSYGLRALTKLSLEKFEALVADPEAPRPRSGPEMRVLLLSAIRADERAQPRAALDMDKVAEYVEAMQRGAKFPAPIVFDDATGVFWPGDGHHRIAAATKLKLKKIECEVRSGGLREAILYSCGANATHGLPRTNDDKHRAVTKLLKDDEWKDWSDNKIAKQCKVSNHLVAQLRKELEPVTWNSPSEPRTYITKHGTTSTMNTANIGGKPGEPDASGPERASPDVTDGAAVAQPNQAATEPTPPQKPSTPLPAAASPELATASKPTTHAPVQPDMFKPAPPNSTPADTSDETPATPQKRWENEIFLRMHGATSLTGSWDTTYPGWGEFDPSEYVINAVDSIVAAWSKIAEELKARRRTDAAD